MIAGQRGEVEREEMKDTREREAPRAVKLNYEVPPTH
jgi:hypothetical protein